MKPAVKMLKCAEAVQQQDRALYILSIVTIQLLPMEFSSLLKQAGHNNVLHTAVKYTPGSRMEAGNEAVRGCEYRANSCKG